MRIAIYGSGSVGGYFGGKLAQAGEEVIFIARGAHLEAIRRDGLKVESIRGDFVISPARATDDPAAVGAVDVVIVGVKTWDVPGAAEAMRPLVGPDTLVVPLQNGVDAPGQLAAALDQPGRPPHVIGGLCAIVSLVPAPGVIRHAGMEPYIAFNRLDTQPDARVERLREAFARAGVAVEVPAEIDAALWSKFAFIAPFAGVGAVTRAPAGTLRSIPETRAMLEAAIGEVEALARARGVALPADIAARTLAQVDGLPPAATASMQRDIMGGRPSELESLNGAVVRLGRESGVPVPTHAMIYASLLPQERAARGKE
jgi:2-dehydropantoate 2-reductase